jgi:hypothetical protein
MGLTPRIRKPKAMSDVDLTDKNTAASNGTTPSSVLKLSARLVGNESPANGNSVGKSALMRSRNVGRKSSISLSESNLRGTTVLRSGTPMTSLSVHGSDL